MIASAGVTGSSLVKIGLADLRDNGSDRPALEATSVVDSGSGAWSGDAESGQAPRGFRSPLFG